MSIESIRDLASEHAREAKRMGIKPYVVKNHEDIDALREDRATIPFIGDYVPEGYYLIDELFVDSSGFGTESEPAMTIDRFLSSLEIGKAYAVREDGQFQVYVGVYGINGGKPNMRVMAA